MIRMRRIDGYGLAGCIFLSLGYCGLPLLHAALPEGAIGRHPAYMVCLMWFCAGEYAIYRGARLRYPFPFGAFAIVATTRFLSPVAGLCTASLDLLWMVAFIWWLPWGRKREGRG